MNELLSLFSSFVNFPTWLRNSIYILSALSIIGVGLAFSPIVALIVAIGLLLVIICLGIYAYVMKARRERQQAALSGGLEQNTLTTPLGISDPARRARLDALRKRFQEGVDKFKSVGKDLYKLPWYVVIGEPAAGKSEAIRRSDVGFPPGMQDEFQGVGGTINMNWWFTNSAVILDTAGRLLFEEVAPGTTSEWKEFLGLLRKHRPNCPINGLLLVIPADSLIKDNAKRIQERAGWIARQLDNIQRELDLRFPVYVVVSKCDLLNGFREFFEDVDDPPAQRQMLGWSNPDALDAAFRPELVDQHLATVVERLRRRRLALLEDPVAKDSNGRRTEEVDRLYAFPNSLSLIAPNLRQYLSTIFVAGEWSAKPLFLRGIYFTSSLREGAELDQELALAMGVSVEELPSGRAWERETSYFLRDLFLEKIFREWGLVTRATDTKKLLRRRALALFGAAGLALLALLLLSWFGYSSMKESIGRQSGYWLRAGEGWSDDHRWMPLVTKGDAGYTYNGDKPVGRGERSQTRDLFDGGGKSLVNFHATLRALTEKPLRISPVFRPFYRFVGNFDAERRQAQRIVFEGSVIKPLLDATRSKMMAPLSAAAPESPQVEADALLSLIQIEAGLAKRQQIVADGIASPEQVIAPMQRYVASRDYDSTLAEVADWTYTKGDGARKWPSGWMSGGTTLVSDKEGYNKPIDLGIERFRQSIQRSLAASEARWQLIRELADFLKREFEPKELDLIQAASVQGKVQQLDPLLETPYKEFEGMCVTLGERLQAAKKADLFKTGPVSLEAAYEIIIKDRRQAASSLKVMVDSLLAATLLPETQVSRPSPLLKEIQERLNGIAKESQSELQGLDLAELKRLDETYVAEYARSGPVYSVRADLYARSLKTTRVKAQFDRLIGTDWAALKKLIEDISNARKEVIAYQGKQKKEFATVCAYWLDYAETHQVDACCAAYQRQAREALAPFIRFPLVWPPEEAALTGDNVKAAAKLVATIHKDLRSETFGKIRAESRLPLEAFDKRVAMLDPVLRGLVAPGDRIATCRISMPAGPPPPPPIPTPPPVPDPVTKLLPVPAPTPKIPVFMYELRAHTPSSRETGAGNLGKQGRVKVGDGRVLIDRLPLDTVFHFHAWLDDQKKEVECGNNWSALRLLSWSTTAAQDGLNWEVKREEAFGAALLNVRLEQALTPIAQWPTRETLGLGQ